MVPSLALLSAGGAGDADAAVDVELGHAGSPELEFLGGGVHPRDPLLEPAAGADVTKNGGHAGSLRLWHTFRNGEAVPQIGVFHTPRLRNITIPIQGYRVPTTRHPSTEWAFPQAVDLKPNRSCRIILGYLIGAEP